MQTKSLPINKDTVFFILPEFPPSFGGMQAHAIKMVEYFKNFYNLHVYVYKNYINGTPQNTQQGFILKPVLSRIAYHYNLNKIIKDALKHKPKFIYSSTVFYGNVKEFIDIPIIARSIGNDILRPWILYPFKFGSNILASHPVDSLFLFLKQYTDKPPYISLIFHKIRKKLINNSIKKSDYILANSEFTYNLIKNIKPNGTIILPGGVDTKIFSPVNKITKTKIREELNLPEDKFIIINACRFVEKKGLLFLINNFKYLSQIYEDLHLILIGDGPQKKKLLKAKQGYKNIEILPKQNMETLVKYYQSADLFVSTSYVVENPITGEKDVETMGRSLCEANACGLPVLSSKTGGTTSIITHNYNGLLFKELNSYDFLQKFHLIYRNKNLRNRLAQNGIKIASSKWDWKHIIKKHEQIFSKIS